MRKFVVVWLGQLMSVLGSSLTSFALGVWVFQSSASVFQFALIGFFTVTPRVLFSPLAGVVVDRWDRGKVMILADTGAGLCTATLVLLLMFDHLAVWHIYVVVALSSAFNSLQWPAYMAAVSSLVSGRNLGRANGLIQLAQAAADVLAPAIAALLLQSIQLIGVVIVDLVSFGFAVLTLCVISIPRHDECGKGSMNKRSMASDLSYGWRYIAARKPLLGLLLVSASSFFFWGLLAALITPMILGFADTQSLGILLSIAGTGMISGAVVMSVWGGPSRRLDGVLRFEFLSGFCFCVIGWMPSFWTVAIGAFGAHMTIAIIDGSGQAMWQSKVDRSSQGRVFAAQQMLARVTSPVAYLLAAPLVESDVMAAVSRASEWLSGVLGGAFGGGSAGGIGLAFWLMGFIKMAIALIAQRSTTLRDIDETLPDVNGLVLLEGV